MKRAILSLLLLAVIGCTGELNSDPGPAVTLTGGWNYTMQLDDGTTAHGAMTLTQEGSRVTGSVDLPTDATVDAGTWRWDVLGWVDGHVAGLRASAHADCGCDTAPVDWACRFDGLIDCGPTFSATYAGGNQ